MNENNQLKKTLTLFNSITLILGSVVGSGILLNSSEILRLSGSQGLSLMVWINSGLISILGSLSYAELGTMIPVSGGDYIYIMKAFGPFVAFIKMWVEVIIIKPSFIAVNSIIFADYFLKGIYSVCAPMKSSILLLSILCILFLTAVNCLSVNVSTVIQDLSTGVKVMVLLSIIFTGIYYLSTGHMVRLNFSDSTNKFTFIALAHYQGLITYSGWQSLTNVSDEMKNVQRDLPISLSFSIITITVVYVFSAISFYSALTMTEIINSDDIAIDFGNSLYVCYGYFLTIGIVGSMLGSVNGLIFTTSRLVFIAARHNHMPYVLNTINMRFNTPTVAICFTGLLSTCYTLFTDFTFLLTLANIVNWVSVIVSVSTLVYFRSKWPDCHRPVKVHLFIPIVFILFVGTLVVVTITTSPKEAGIGLLVAVSAIPVYVFVKNVLNNEQFRVIIEKVEKTIAVVTWSCEEKRD